MTLRNKWPLLFCLLFTAHLIGMYPAKSQFLWRCCLILPAIAHADVEILHPVSGCIFPPDVPAPEILWRDSDPAPNHWNLVIEFNDIGPGYSQTIEQPGWRPSPEIWKEIQDRTVNNAAVVRVYRSDQDSLSGDRVILQTVDTPLSAPVLLHEQATSAQGSRTCQLRITRISAPGGLLPATVSESLSGYVRNSFGGSHLLFVPEQTPGAEGFYLLPLNTHLFLDPQYHFFPPAPGGQIFSPAPAPGGKQVVAVVASQAGNKASSGPPAGLLYRWDAENGVATPVPGASDPGYLYATPAWSPDGIWLYFSRLKLTSDTAAHWTLMRLNMDVGASGRPVPVVSTPSQHTTHPSPSPDGRWLICEQRSAQPAALTAVCSTLILMPSRGGRKRPLFCNRTCPRPRKVSWSPDSRWILFSSGTCSADGDLWVSHIDPFGNDSPPVRWNAKTPDGMTTVQALFTGSLQSSAPPVLHPETRPSRIAYIQGTLAAASGKSSEAIGFFQAALKLSPGYLEAARALFSLCMKTGSYAEAIPAIKRLCPAAPASAEPLFLLAALYMQTGALEDAEQRVITGLSRAPLNTRGLKLAAEITQKKHDDEQSIRYYTRYLNQKPDDHCARTALARLLAENGDRELAVATLAVYKPKQLPEPLTGP